MNDFIDENTVFLLDSYGLIFREYYAFFSHPLTNSKGENVSALFGVFRNMSILLKNFSPKYFIAAMESRTPTFRHEQFAEYKATRAKTPDDLKAQFPMIEECFGVLGIPVVRADGFEADDVIATIAKKCDEAGRHCVILSSDKDLQQLVNENIHILRPDKTKTWSQLGADDILSEWGVESEKLLDLLSLMGDTADNVPGVSGVGQKTAVKLIQEYGSLESILENARNIKGSLGEKLRNGKDDAIFSKKLISLRTDVPLSDEYSAEKIPALSLNFKKFADEMRARELPALGKAYDEFVHERKKAGVAPLSDAEEQNGAETESSAAKNSGDYEACTSMGRLIEFVDKAIENGVVALDTETDSLNTREANLVGFSLSFKKGTGIYVPLILNEDALFSPALISKKNALEQLSRIFNSDCTVVLHNAKFDLEVLCANGLDALGIESPPKASDGVPSDEGGSRKCEKPAGGNEVFAERPKKCRIFDTMIAEWLLEPDKTGKSPYSLETLAEQKLGLFGTEFGELVGKNQTFADVKLDEAAKYGAEDADFTFSLWEILSEELKKANLDGLFENLEMKVLPVLSRMELTGIHLNPAILDSYAVELRTNLLKIEKSVYEEVGHEFNIASPKQLSEVLFEERGLRRGKKTRTGYSTDTDVLESLRDSDTVPALILEYRAKSKLLSTYVETLPDMCDSLGRVHTSFMQTGTATGRLSSKDPNLQNIPVRTEEGRKIRSAFTAPDGSVLISADYSQIELVVLAHLSGDERLCAAFRAGNDVHKATAALIFGVGEDDVTPAMRRTAKTMNFGLMYGMSAFRLANELKITRAQAADFIDSYFAAYSGVRKFFDENVSEAEKRGYVQTIMGRRRFIDKINSSGRFEKEGAVRIAKNSPVQGSAADIVKTAMINVSGALDRENIPAKLLLQVHDELIFECPDDEKIIARAVAVITEEMENAVHLNVPLRVSVEVGKSWGEFH